MIFHSFHVNSFTYSLLVLSLFITHPCKVLGQLPPRKIAPNPKTNPNPNPNPNQGVIFLRDNCLVAPHP